MRAYKLLRKLSNGKLYPLFIHKTYSTPFNEWLYAECYPTKGFAVRKGYHCCFKPFAPHLSMQLANGEQRVWVECEVEDWDSYNRPESQGGSWILAQQMKIVRELTENEVEQILKGAA
jgi:hypothetical protein